MRLITSDELHRNPAEASRPALADSVARLAECLTVDATTRQVNEAARAAMAAAEAAELLLAEQRERLRRLERVSVTDALTGLLNRRGMEAEMAKAAAAARRYREPGALIFVDLDGFKPVNDAYGHAAGDAVLGHVGRLLSGSVRPTDSVARLGGDEFAVLLTRTSFEAGLQRAEAFDKLINGAVLQWSGRTIAIRASLGFQAYGPDDDLGDALAAADHAMYAAKEARAGPGRASA